jgi:dihydrofolate reductase
VRKVLYGAACSLDGFIAGENDEVEWLQWSNDVAVIANAVWSTTDAVLMGRRTYDVAVRNGVAAYAGVHNYVFSRALKQEREIPGLTVVSEDAALFVRELKRQPGRDICVMGGGRLASSLLAAGLIDEIGLNVHPILLGNGIRMFPAGFPRASLELCESRPMQGECYYMRYRVSR